MVDEKGEVGREEEVREEVGGKGKKVGEGMGNMAGNRWVRIRWWGGKKGGKCGSEVEE